LQCAGRANRGPQPGSAAGVVVAATALWMSDKLWIEMLIESELNRRRLSR